MKEPCTIPTCDFKTVFEALATALLANLQCTLPNTTAPSPPPVPRAPRPKLERPKVNIGV